MVWVASLFVKCGGLTLFSRMDDSIVISVFILKEMYLFSFLFR